MLHNENEKNAELIRRKRTPGEIVAAERKKRCWTQEELGWRCGISAVQIGKIERDAVRPKIETIKTLEDVLELPLLEFFMEYRHLVDRTKRGLKQSRSALEQFERELAKLKLSDDELKEVLQDAILDAQSRKKL